MQDKLYEEIPEKKHSEWKPVNFYEQEKPENDEKNRI